MIITPNTPKYQELAQGNKEDISWIKKEHVIMREEGSGTRKEAELQLKGAGVKFAGLDIIASIEIRRQLKNLSDRGWGFRYCLSLPPQMKWQNGEILAFPIPNSDEGRDINLVYNKNYQMTRSAERFIKVVKEVYNIPR